MGDPAARSPGRLALFPEQALVVDRALAHEFRYELRFRAKREGSRRDLPRRLPHAWILHRDLVQETSILEFLETLDDVQRFGVHEAVDFSLVVETDGVDHQSVTLPTPDRRTHP